MSWGIDITAAQADMPARLDEETARLSEQLKLYPPTELEDMLAILARAKHYAALIDLGKYNASWGTPERQVNAVRVQAGGSHMSVGQEQAVMSANYRLDVAPTTLPVTAT